jgi:hypothetical protein
LHYSSYRKLRKGNQCVKATATYSQQI